MRNKKLELVLKLGYKYDNQEECYRRPLYSQHFDQVSKVVSTYYLVHNDTFYLEITMEYHQLKTAESVVKECVNIPMQINSEIDHAVLIKLLSLPTEQDKK